VHGRRATARPVGGGARGDRADPPVICLYKTGSTILVDVPTTTTRTIKVQVPRQPGPARSPWFPVIGDAYTVLLFRELPAGT
jgi:hypothetical protein